MSIDSFEDAHLEHYGVKGMQWGVRRTKAQLAKARQERASKKDPSSPEGKVIAERKAASKNRRLLSNEEVDALISRLEKEKKLKNLVAEDAEPGKSFTKSVMSDAGKKTIRNVVTGTALVAGGAIVGKAFGPEFGAAAKKGRVGK